MKRKNCSFIETAVLFLSMFLCSINCFAQPAPACNGKPLPSSCANPCDPKSSCFQDLLNDHFVSSINGYVEDGLAFRWDNVNATISSITGCTSELFFEIYPITESDGSSTWFSTITTQPPTQSLARGFPVALIQAIYNKYGVANIKHFDFFWLSLSPQCPNGDDVLIDVKLSGGNDAYYDLSDPPVRLQGLAQAPHNAAMITHKGVKGKPAHFTIQKAAHHLIKNR